MSVCTAIFVKNEWNSRNSRGYPVLSVCWRNVDPARGRQHDIVSREHEHGLPFAASRAFFSSDRPNDAQNVVLGRFSRTFIASSRKTTSVTGSRLILSTFSSVYTLTQQSAISSMRLSRLPHNAAVHCGAVTLVGSVRTRDLYRRPCPMEVDSVRGGSVSSSYCRAEERLCTFGHDVFRYPGEVERRAYATFDVIRQLGDEVLHQVR